MTPPGSRSRSTEEWQPVCRVAELEVERGATALVHGQAIAIFRTPDDQVYALGNHDPFAKTSVIARGIVGVRDGVPFVASPTHKHAFDLRSGRCLDDDHVSIPAYDVHIIEGVVLVGNRKDAVTPGTPVTPTRGAQG
jgi:nitrite reductase (NADH) small subunit